MKKQKQRDLVGFLAKYLKIDNQNGKFKLPHIGWNEIDIKLKIVKFLKVLKINLICTLYTVMNLFQKIKM